MHRDAPDDAAWIDRFEWRARLRTKPPLNAAYRIGIGFLGLVVVAVGAAAVPLPGPGWLIVFAGLGIWGTEFAWARDLLHFARRKVHGWNQWLAPKPWWVKALVGLVVCAFVLGAMWAMFAISGVPGLLPDSIENLLRKLPGVS
ncbi:uncharacterized protein (TIGR02611 family) [Rudaeicoccus suwonensis]|uniref:Uncharacterized protein (TIGR02611 family) n=2 Tax=Rudaeicoccus suwonensis TaxID=657409 RepID=A0A561EBE0_9MICO|nr:uncharacterized protein (TIGR02611 family) [Rudaeicoccus suwonensis]